MLCPSNSEAPMSISRSSLVRVAAALFGLAMVASVLVVAGSMNETGLSVSATGDGPAPKTTVSAGDVDATTPDTGVRVLVEDDAEQAAPGESDEHSPSPAAPPVPAPLDPPIEPEVGPLGALNLDPASAGITDYQGLGVPQAGDHGGPGVYSVGTGCASACIDSGVATPLGTGAHLEVVTDTAAQIWIVVWNESLGHHFVVDSGSDVTSFGADFTELAAGTTYQAMAVAEDANGYSDHAYGEFDTLRRHVRFGLSNVVVTNQPSNTESFSTDKWADGQRYAGGWETPFPTIEDVDESVEVVLQLVAHLPCDDLCQAVAGSDEIPPHNSGRSDRSEWILLSLWDLPSQNRLPIDLENTPALVESSTARTFVVTLTNGPAGGALPGDYGGPLSARVDVTVWITYR